MGAIHFLSKAPQASLQMRLYGFLCLTQDGCELSAVVPAVIREDDCTTLVGREPEEQFPGPCADPIPRRAFDVARRHRRQPRATIRVGPQQVNSVAMRKGKQTWPKKRRAAAQVSWHSLQREERTDGHLFGRCWPGNIASQGVHRGTMTKEGVSQLRRHRTGPATVGTGRVGTAFCAFCPAAQVAVVLYPSTAHRWWPVRFDHRRTSGAQLVAKGWSEQFSNAEYRFSCVWYVPTPTRPHT